MNGQTGSHRTFAELQADMEQAIRDGRITDNVVGHLVRELKTGKIRARKLRDWAKETGLFERVRAEHTGTSAADGTVDDER
ncbi:hypothetical protein GTW20_03910 [Nocardiopsis alba]|uniref:Uncharacterized protein n=1 Tax=Nocardiopsis alba TaxID=53437 RepID=A0A7K2IN82_9ACTN|nr:hypothetical protein [Nocardiopsis alba]MYR31430.1 hypothetical protein [Nocardiopsis alba]